MQTMIRRFYGIRCNHSSLSRPFLSGFARTVCFPHSCRPYNNYSIEKGSVVPLYLGGTLTHSDTTLPVYDKYTGAEFCHVALADAGMIEKATALAAGPGRDRIRALLPYQRQQILHNVAVQAKDRHEEFAFYVTLEAGKPITDARGEVDRFIATFQIAAEEATRIHGEYMDLQNSSRAVGYTSITKRIPIGPICCISPFNFPLNLVAHKVAPAIAAGCPFVLKPASKTPIGALLIGQILAADPNMPKEAFSILPCTRDAGDLLVKDDRYKLLSFKRSNCGIAQIRRQKVR
jgi:acyl-CoA reductase-like NAD-dependent aldehyde dehydrogenase